MVNVSALRLQSRPRDSNCFSAVLGLDETYHVMLSLPRPPLLASLRHPCPEAPAHMIQLTHEERTEPYVSVPINWCPLSSARRHCSAPGGRDHLTFAFSQRHTSEARVRQMR